VTNASVAFLFLGACLHLAGLIGADSAPARELGAARQARSACDRGDVSAPARVTKRGKKFTLTVGGTARKTKKPALRVKCRVQGNGIVYRVRARKKGVPLRKVVGNQLSLGVLSPANASTSVLLKVTFATP
jgi:hypothetical protein